MRRSRLTESSTTSILRCGAMRSGNFRPQRVKLMQKSRVVIYFFALFILGVGTAGAQAPAAARPPDPVVGAWKLNLAKSKYVTPAPKGMTVISAFDGADRLRRRQDVVRDHQDPTATGQRDHQPGRLRS